MAVDIKYSNCSWNTAVHISQHELLPFGCRSRLKEKNGINKISVYLMRKAVNIKNQVSF
jgi:hypothetical protein